MPLKRIFVAIDIPRDVRERIGSYISVMKRQFPETRAKWERSDKLHITVKFAGSIDENALRELSRKVETIAGQISVFDAEVSGTGVFPQRRGGVLWLGVIARNTNGDPFGDLAELLDEDAERKFTPHLTIARLKEKKNAGGLIAAHRNADLPSLNFRIGKLTIYESTLHPGGSVFTPPSFHPLKGG